MAEDDSMDLWFFPEDTDTTEPAETSLPSTESKSAQKASKKPDNKSNKRLGGFFNGSKKRLTKRRRQLIEQIQQFAEQTPTPLWRENFDIEELYEWETEQLEAYLKWMMNDKARRESLSFSAQLQATELIPKLKLLFIDTQLADSSATQQHHNINISTPDFSAWNPVVLEKYFHVLQSYKYYRDALDPNADYYYHAGLWHFCEWLYLRAKGIDPSRCFTMDASLVIKCLRDTAEIPLDIIEKRYRQDVRYFYGVPAFENGTNAELTRYIIRIEPLLRCIPSERQPGQKTGNVVARETFNGQGNPSSPHVSAVIRKRNCRPNITEAFEDLAQMLTPKVQQAPSSTPSQTQMPAQSAKPVPSATPSQTQMPAQSAKPVPSATPSQTHLLAQEVNAQVATSEPPKAPIEKAAKQDHQEPPKTPSQKEKAAKQEHSQTVPPELPKQTKKTKSAKPQAEMPELPKTKAEIQVEPVEIPMSETVPPKTKGKMPELPKTKAKTKAETPEIKAESQVEPVEIPVSETVAPKNKGKMPEMPKTKAKAKAETPEIQAVLPELPKQAKKTKAAETQAETQEVQKQSAVLPELPKQAKKTKAAKAQTELSETANRSIKSPELPQPPAKKPQATPALPPLPPSDTPVNTSSSVSSIVSLDDIDLEFQVQPDSPLIHLSTIIPAVPAAGSIVAPQKPDTLPKPEIEKTAKPSKPAQTPDKPAQTPETKSEKLPPKPSTKPPKEKKKPNNAQSKDEIPVCADGTPIVMTSKEARALKRQQQKEKASENLAIDVPLDLLDDDILEDKRTQRISMTKEIADLLSTEAQNLGLQTPPKPSKYPGEHIAITTALNQNYAFQMPCPISQLFADEIRKWIEETTPFDPHVTDYRRTIFKGILEFTQYFSPDDRFPLARVCAEIPRILNTLPCLSMAQPDISRDMTWALFSALGFITGWASSLINDEASMQLQLVQTWQRLHGKRGTEEEMFEQAMRSLGVVRNANRYHPMHWRIAFDMEPSQPDYRRFVSCMEGLIRWHKWNIPELPIFDPQTPFDNWCLAWSQPLKANGYCIAEFRYLPSAPNAKRYIFLMPLSDIDEVKSLFAAYMQGEHLRIWL